MKHTFTKLGRQEVSIEQVVSATGESHTLHAYVMVKVSENNHYDIYYVIFFIIIIFAFRQYIRPDI